MVLSADEPLLSLAHSPLLSLSHSPLLSLSHSPLLCLQRVSRVGSAENGGL